MQFLKVVMVSGLTVGASCTYAADSLVKKYDFVLVQLRSESNRIAAMRKNKDNQGLETVLKDGSMVRKVMIKDFKENFNHCPVYFYIDTNLDLVKQRKFTNVLFTSDSVPINNLKVTDTASNYLIVYYGHPNVQKKEYNANKNDGRYNDNQAQSKGLIINNADFEQISYLYKFEYQNFTFRWNKKLKDKCYVSKRFDIEYFPYAGKLNEVLMNFKGYFDIKNSSGIQSEKKKK